MPWTQEQIAERNREVFGSQAPAYANTGQELVPSGGTGEKAAKYHNRKKEVDGITFDSSKEANRYIELKALLACGAIEKLTLQPEFLLQEPTRGMRAIKYRADFQYQVWPNWIVEDVKGVRTPVYRLKAKLFRAKFPYIELREI